jgi:hypothetical protein
VLRTSWLFITAELGPGWPNPKPSNPPPPLGNRPQRQARDQYPQNPAISCYSSLAGLGCSKKGNASAPAAPGTEPIAANVGVSREQTANDIAETNSS